MNLNLISRARTGQPPVEATAGQGRQRGFSLIELMITIALLTVIVLGLLAMFTQTQRVFRANMAQADYNETGRTVMEQLVRDIEQMTPSRIAFTTNYFAEISPSFNKPLTQGLPGTPMKGDPSRQELRTNVVQRIFFLTQMNQAWVGIGYQVIPEATNAGLGSLYRFSTNGTRFTAPYLPTAFLQAPLGRLDRIADGVVHLRLRAFATNGLPITPAGFEFMRNQFLRIKNATNYWEQSLPDQVRSYFVSNAVPAYLELELGILEPRVVDRFRALGQGSQYEYLSNHVAQVHLFRQRIPIRNVDFAAYQ